MRSAQMQIRFELHVPENDVWLAVERALPSIQRASLSACMSAKLLCRSRRGGLHRVARLVQLQFEQANTANASSMIGLASPEGRDMRKSHVSGYVRAVWVGLKLAATVGPLTNVANLTELTRSSANLNNGQHVCECLRRV